MSLKLALFIISISFVLSKPVQPTLKFNSNILNEGNFDFVENSKEPWLIIFYDQYGKCPLCIKIMNLWDKLANDNAHKNINFGKINAARENPTNKKSLIERYSINEFPDIIYLPKDGQHEKINFIGNKQNIEALIEFASGFIRANTFSQLLNQKQFDDQCLKSICFILFLAPLKDINYKKRSRQLEEFKEISESDAFDDEEQIYHFLWVNGYEQTSLNMEILGMQMVNFKQPRAAAIRGKSNKYAFQLDDSAFGKYQLKKWYEKFISGDHQELSLSKHEKFSIKEVDPWDQQKDQEAYNKEENKKQDEKIQKENERSEKIKEKQRQKEELEKMIKEEERMREEQEIIQQQQQKEDEVVDL